MKIALVILHADTARGGAERYTLDLAVALVNRGHDISILASSFQTQPTAGKRVLLDATGHTRTGRYERFLDSLDAELDRERYDIVHAMLPVRRCDVYHPHAGIAAESAVAGHLVKSGWIHQMLAAIGNRFNRRRQRFAVIERRLLTWNRPPVVLCLSNLIRDVVHRYYPNLPADRLVPLFNGINLTRFDPARLPNARQRIRDQYHIATDSVVGLILAQDFERKGVGIAIQALAKVTDLKLSLMIGGKPDATRYRKLARKLGVSDRIRFTGPVSDPVAFYQAADFFLLPTRFDPCSLVVLEALAMGLPVISTSKNGACEIMRKGEHGNILDDYENIPILTAAMVGMISTDRRMAMATACNGLRPKLSEDRHMKQLLAIYTGIIARNAEFDLSTPKK